MCSEVEAYVIKINWLFHLNRKLGTNNFCYINDAKETQTLVDPLML